MTLEGTFHDMSLSDLFEVFRLGSKSGVLQLFSASQSASLYVTMGRVIDAVLAQWPNQGIIAAGDEAILQLLQWTEAEFIFTPDRSVVHHPVTIFHDIDQLLNFALRQQTKGATLQHAPISSPIAVDCAFAQDLMLAAPGYAENPYRKLSLECSKPTSFAALRKETSSLFELMPCAESEWEVAAVAVAEPTEDALLEKEVAGFTPTLPERIVAAPVRSKSAQPSRRLMQAVLRRVRSL